MKLRIRGNTLRLRLTRPEVEGLAKDGRVEDSIAFGPDPGARLTYAIVVREAPSIRAEWSDRAITVVLPPAVASGWTGSEEVGIEQEQPIGGSKTLRVTVEKDFACLTQRPGEDDGDAYPNPNTSC
jgi:Family of unknown function (DUF7009)